MPIKFGSQEAQDIVIKDRRERIWKTNDKLYLPCPDCNGSGIDPSYELFGDNEDCSCCGGSGEVHRSYVERLERIQLELREKRLLSQWTRNTSQ